MRWKLMLASVLAVGGMAYAQDRPRGYLEPGEFDAVAVIGAAPVEGDPRYESDREIFHETRKLIGTPRYELATRDVKGSPADMLKAFSCAVGVELTPENSPKLAATVQRAIMDTAGQAGRAKDFYKRERPYVIDPGQTVCQAPEELLDRRTGKASYDYPSGHSTVGWTYATVIAGAAPDRAQAALERGRAFAESRMVCGMHNATAVQAGILTAAATMSVVQNKPEYQADLAAAREELTALRRTGTSPTSCDVEQALLAQRVMPGEVQP
ncbi:MAG TPA: phosphatase PAP2 family protein [Croceibacterium sp.]|nr:phosphatase PAP2 family protein [Croceibacterium sp.]